MYVTWLLLRDFRLLTSKPVRKQEIQRLFFNVNILFLLAFFLFANHDNDKYSLNNQLKGRPITQSILVIFKASHHILNFVE